MALLPIRLTEDEWNETQDTIADLLAACERDAAALANLAMMVDPEETKRLMDNIYAAVARAKREG